MLGVSPNKDNSVYSLPIDDSPSNRQGFGRVALLQSLFLNTSLTTPNFSMQVYLRNSILNQYPHN